MGRIEQRRNADQTARVDAEGQRQLVAAIGAMIARGRGPAAGPDTSSVPDPTGDDR